MVVLGGGLFLMNEVSLYRTQDAATETVFNLQSASLFIDLRIPRGPNFRLAFTELPRL